MSGQSDFDVIVVGAGAAGLAASRACRAQGLRVAALEAENAELRRAEEISAMAVLGLPPDKLHLRSGAMFPPPNAAKLCARSAMLCASTKRPSAHL